MHKYGKAILWSSGAIASVAYLYWAWYSNNAQQNSTGRRKRKRRKIPGLYNVGNTCFMNVILQSFAGQASFVKWLKEVSRNHQCKEKHLLAQSLSSVMDAVFDDAEHSCYDPSFLLTDLSARGWTIPYDEHDAHEFFHVVISTLEDELKHSKAPDVSLNSLSAVVETKNQKALSRCEQSCDVTIDSCDDKHPLDGSISNLLLKDHLYRGTFSVYLKCSACDSKNPITYESFDSLSLPIGPGFPIRKMNLLDCLHSYLACELLHDVQCENCTQRMNNVSQKYQTSDQNQNINKSVMAEDTPTTRSTNHPLTAESMIAKISLSPCKQIEIEQANDEQPLKVKSSFYKMCKFSKLPKCLCIHLQRLVWKHGTPIKLGHFVDFPELLDLGPFAHGYDKQGPPLSQHNPVFHSILSSFETRKSPLLSNCARSSSQFPSGLKGGSNATCKLQQPRRVLYQLTSVVVHLGDWSFNGHFVAYRRMVYEDTDGTKVCKWFYTSDDCVQEVGVRDVLANPAYLLFYEKVA
ncbi:ubiquitin carboxyl-terminal hydrolase 30-like [Clavelina lepadiformis]|uniref:ubiquitin carboxyl-terminal hydrolase 30-like n=1 Tax=Clavelina lepadiformis TaxID=159417 RepID=UPI0040410A6C